MFLSHKLWQTRNKEEKYGEANLQIEILSHLLLLLLFSSWYYYLRFPCYIQRMLVLLLLLSGRKIKVRKFEFQASWAIERKEIWASSSLVPTNFFETIIWSKINFFPSIKLTVFSLLFLQIDKNLHPNNKQTTNILTFPVA